MREKEKYPEPGRELDALVAERVMGDVGRMEWYASGDGGKSGYLFTNGENIWKEHVEKWIVEHPVMHDGVVKLCSHILHRHYSTDDAEAMSVVMKLREALPSMIWQSGEYRGDCAKLAWVVAFRDHGSFAVHESFAAAVCLAALATVANRGAV